MNKIQFKMFARKQKYNNVKLQILPLCQSDMEVVDVLLSFVGLLAHEICIIIIHMQRIM